MKRVLAAVLLGAVACPSGCVSASVDAITPERAPVPAAELPIAADQPRYGYYACEGGSELTVENFQTSVLVVTVARDGVELPARPAGQTRTYGDGRSRLVLDGSSAEFAREGKPTLVCRR